MLGISQFPVIPDYSMDILDKNRQDGYKPHLRQDSTSSNRHLEINLIKQQQYGTKSLRIANRYPDG